MRWHASSKPSGSETLTRSTTIVEDYVQHVAQAANGLQAAKDYCAPVGPVDVEVHG
jgi:hypothetical protein